MNSFLFYMFASFALLAGIMVIRAKNPVYSVLFLILVFCNVSGLLLLIHNLNFMLKPGATSGRRPLYQAEHGWLASTHSSCSCLGQIHKDDKV